MFLLINGVEETHGTSYGNRAEMLNEKSYWLPIYNYGFLVISANLLDYNCYFATVL